MRDFSRISRDTFRVFGPLLLVSMAACASEDLANTETDGETLCRYTWECVTGYVCDDGICVVPSTNSDPNDGDPNDGDPNDGDPNDGDPNDDDPNDGDPNDGDPNDGDPNDGDPNDGDPNGGDSSPKPVIGEAHYRVCQRDGDCAVFSGNCVTEVHLSRPDLDGRTKVLISELAPELLQPGQGVCTDACTNDPRVCSNLVATNAKGDSAPYTCQLIYAGSNPYLEANGDSDFLDAVAMARGIAYASICRPPFAYAASVSDSFCESCSTDADCLDDARCNVESPNALKPKGSCVAACQTALDCPVGFVCGNLDPLDSQDYCLPIESTCGHCLDLDGDERGVGRCGPTNAPNTAVDCDEEDPDRYYDADHMRHPFPTYCGANIDMNCNLISDEFEQLGSNEHCAECFDTCGSVKGTIANGRWNCSHNEDESTQTEYSCEAVCLRGYGDCDDEPGCETKLDADTRWYKDVDGDGFGDSKTETYFCPGTVPSTGWVQQSGDCDDTNNVVYPGAPELCDGLDNDCNGDIDNDIDDPRLGQPCLDFNVEGVCAEGRNVCDMQEDNEAIRRGTVVCQSKVDVAAQQLVAETCDCKDNNCDGEIDNGVVFNESCVVPSAYGICRAGALTCGLCADKTDADGEPETDEYGRVVREIGAPICSQSVFAKATDRLGDGIDENCDGFDGDAQNTVFVSSRDGFDSAEGSIYSPVKSVQRALELACNSVSCKDIALAGGEYVMTSSLKIPVFQNVTNAPTPYYDEQNRLWVSGTPAKVRLHGGYEVGYGDCTYEACDISWVRGDSSSRSVLVRKTPSDPREAGNAGQYYAAIEPGAGPGGVSLHLDQVDVEVRNEMHTPSSSLRAWHAPSLVGIMCISSRCALLSFRYVNMRVDRATAGYSGDFKAREQLAQFVAARSGCITNKTAQGGDALNIHCANSDFLGNTDFWMNYGSKAMAERDDFGGRNNACDNSTTKGKNSGGFSYYLGSETTRTYPYAEGANGSPGARDYADEDYESWTSVRPVNGNDGRQGTAGSHTISQSGGFLAANRIGQVIVSREPSSGRDGNGGGGGAGCLEFGDKSRRCYGEVDIRGGGGGAGGCGGEAGVNGGFGGHTLGIALTSHNTMPTRIETHPIRAQNQAFSVQVEGAGSGGDGGGAEAGQAGDVGRDFSGSLANKYPKQDVSALVWRSNAEAYHVGRNGGAGGGGGGGAGGNGGDALGIAYHCSSGTSCELTMPAHMRLSPLSYIRLPASAASGGLGGENGFGGTAPNGSAGAVDAIRKF